MTARLLSLLLLLLHHCCQPTKSSDELVTTEMADAGLALPLLLWLKTAEGCEHAVQQRKRRAFAAGECRVKPKQECTEGVYGHELEGGTESARVNSRGNRERRQTNHATAPIQDSTLRSIELPLTSSCMCLSWCSASGGGAAPTCRES